MEEEYSNLTLLRWEQEKGFPGGASGEEPACQCRRHGLDPWDGKETATHSSILAWEIPMDRGAWWAAVHGIEKSQTGLRMSERARKWGRMISCSTSSFPAASVLRGHPVTHTAPAHKTRGSRSTCGLHSWSTGSEVRKAWTLKLIAGMTLEKLSSSFEVPEKWGKLQAPFRAAIRMEESIYRLLLT